MNPMKQQAGGTLLGFIIGLLVGLGVALGVAVYVTKTPIPLVDKGVQRKPDQEAVEKERNKDWNPNAGLASKNVPTMPVDNAAQPDASGSTAAAPAAPVSTAVPVPVPPGADTGKPSVPATKPATKDVSSKDASKPASKDPLGDLIQSRADSGSAGAKASKTDGTDDPFIYFVQVGAYRTPEDAEAQRAKLAMLGLDAKVTERDQSGRTVYRVRLGPFNRKSDADKAQERLSNQGMDAALVRTQR